MIGFVDNLPLVEFPAGRVFAFRGAWLRENLLRAAADAGYADWWLADHVTKSITEYLESQFAGPVVTVARLADAVRHVLMAIGWADVARHFQASRPAGEISLLQIAQECGGYELAFFERLRAAILSDIRDGAAVLSLVDIVPAVKLMTGAKVFTRFCAGLRDEIVGFSRHCICLNAGEKRMDVVIR
ncbi:MAG TPA: hypothetical protein VIT21_03830 [Chthoniobacterales bacterium]